MAKVHVIARFVAQEGRENQLKALLQGMLIPTRAESGCDCMNSSSQTPGGAFISTKHGKVGLPLIDTWQHPTLSA